MATVRCLSSHQPLLCGHREVSKLSPVSVLSGDSDGGSSEKGRDKKEGANSKAGGDAKAAGSSMSSLGDLPFLNSGSLTSAPNSKPGVWVGGVV